MYKKLFVLFVLCWCAAVSHAQEEPIHHRGNPQHTGVYSAEAILTTPDVRWERHFASQDVDISIVEDQLFVTATETRNQSTIYALNGDSGETNWSVTLRGVVIGSPAYAGDLMLLGTTSGLMALDMQNGETRWTFARPGSVWSSLLVVGDTVFITSQRGWFGVALETGEERWHNPACNGSGGAAFNAQTVFFPCENAVYALSPETGDMLWMVEVPEADFYNLAVDDDLIIATGMPYIAAIDPLTKSVLWQVEGGDVWSAPVLAEETVFAGNMDGWMMAMDRDDGTELWRFDTGDWATTAPILLDETLYFGYGNHFDPPSPREFYALQAGTGEIVWQITVDGMVISEAEVRDGILYTATNNGTVYALEGK